MKYIELFAGIGGFRLGLDRIPGFDSVWANEWDVLAQRKAWEKDDSGVKFLPTHSYRIYRKHYGTIDIRDIRSVTAGEIPEHDLLTAGFPCQAFSVSGRQGGFEDTRGTLFFEIARVLQHQRPGHILLENVQNLLGHEDGKTFHRILGVLSDLGYRCEWQVLDSKHFRVPQERKRMFIVGHLRGRCAGKILPIIGTGGKDVVEVLTKGMRTAQGARFYDPSGSSVTIVSRGGGLGAKTGLYVVVNQRDKLQIREDETTPCIMTNYRGLGRQRSGIMEVFDSGEVRIRKLMPIECERVQGFPDGWTKWGIINSGLVLISDTQRYKGLGNAVTVNVKAIGKRLIQCS